MQLIALFDDAWAAAWETIAPFAQKMAERFPDDWPMRVIVEAAAEKSLLLWAAWDEDAKKVRALVGTRIVQKPNGELWLDIPLMGADDERDLWLPLIGKIEEYARASGCTKVCFEGREGWAKRLPDYRVYRRFAVLQKDLTDGRS